VSGDRDLVVAVHLVGLFGSLDERLAELTRLLRCQRV
jgi:hypothetical protein